VAVQPSSAGSILYAYNVYGQIDSVGNPAGYVYLGYDRDATAGPLACFLSLLPVIMPALLCGFGQAGRDLRGVPTRGRFG
jgi:hypothetical protein